jgi:hypothetical protein
MRDRLAILLATLGLVAVLALLSPAIAGLYQPPNAPPAPPPPQAEKEKMPQPNPVVAQALGTIVKFKADMSVQGAYACCIRPGCNFCPLAADKCPCRSNVKTPAGVCGECKAGWEAGVGAVEGVRPENVQQIKGDMLKMMYSMRGPREKMVSGRGEKPAPGRGETPAPGRGAHHH